MLNYLRYYIYFLLKENPAKFFFFTSTLIFFLWANWVTTKKIPKTNNYNNISWIDTTQKKIVYLNQTGYYSFYEYSDHSNYNFDAQTKTLTINYVEVENEVSKSILVVVFVVLLIISIISIIIEILNEEINFFDLKDVEKRTLRKLIIMDEEGDTRYYHLMGRLICEDIKVGNYYNINNIRDLSYHIESYIENHKVFPKWKGTTQDRRDTLLTKLLS